MLSKEKALYQAKLIIENLSSVEYELLPKDYLKYIEENYEYDSEITINPNIPLEEQNIDERTCEILEKLTKDIDFEQLSFNNNLNKLNFNEDNQQDYLSKVESENIELNNLIKILKKENEKLPKAKSLIEDYQKELKLKNDEIDTLKENNKVLYETIQKVPKFLRKIFIKDDKILSLKQ